MYQPALYRQLLNDYAGRQLPKVDRLARDLHLSQKYGILKDAATAAAETFLESAEFAEFVDTKGFLRSKDDLDAAVEEKSTDQQRSSLGGTDRGNSAEQRTKQDAVKQPPPVSVGHTAVIPPTVEGLDRIEVQLLNGKKAYLFVPVPLPFGENERLKKYIDLLLEEPPPAPQPQFTASAPSNSVRMPIIQTGPAV